MMGGCTACQNSTPISWHSWSSNCSNVSVGYFPQDIPVDTAVPGWAFDTAWANTPNGTFDPQVALGETNLPESTATHVPTTQTRSSGSSTSSSGEQATSSAAPASKTSSSNVGAIVGGVVGGVVGLAMIALIAFLFIKRSKNHKRGATSSSGSPVSQEKMDLRYHALPYVPTPVSTHSLADS